MCGIGGVVDATGRAPDQALLRQIGDAQAHRGPDGAGYHLGPGVGLVSRRLRIIDLETGDQPIRNEDETISVVYNGEIYNYQELRAELERRGHRFRTRSDTEVIPHAYEEYGDDFVTHLNGMFAIALWDATRQRLVLARDRLGKKPLVYAPLRYGLVFASELQGLLRHPSLQREADPEAIDAYLSFGYVPAPRTAFRGVQKLLPGHLLTWDREQGIQTRAYWHVEYRERRGLDERTALEEFEALFSDSVRRRLIADVPLGVFLSGGLDSSAVLAEMSRLSDRPVKAFSIGFGEPDFDEVTYAREVARRFGAEHHVFLVEPKAAGILPILVRHFGEPFADSSALPTYFLAQETRRHVTVALNGDGGDELFAGYDRYRAAQLAERFATRLPLVRSLASIAAATLPASAGVRDPRGRARRFLSALRLSPGSRYASWIGIFDPRLKRATFAPEFLALARAARADGLLADPINRRNGRAVLNTLLRVDLTTYLPNDLLVKVDITTMANSLEARSPFLDYRLVEWAATLPADLKLRGRTSKYLLRQAMADWLPPRILSRPKAGFGVPVAEWLRGELRPLLEDLLLSSRFRQRGYFRPEAVHDMVSQHVYHRADWWQPLWALLMLELWHREFTDGAPA